MGKRIRIRKTKKGISIKATGGAAQDLFNAITKDIEKDEQKDKKNANH